jgi:hypothetical protein
MLGAAASADPRPRGRSDLAAMIAVAPVPPRVLPHRQPVSWHMHRNRLTGATGPSDFGLPLDAIWSISFLSLSGSFVGYPAPGARNEYNGPTLKENNG